MSPTTIAVSVAAFFLAAVLFRFAPMTRELYDRLGPDRTIGTIAAAALLVGAGIAIVADDAVLETIAPAVCAGGLVGVLFAVGTFRRRQAVPGAGA